jgi:hypothetical protein
MSVAGNCVVDPNSVTSDGFNVKCTIPTETKKQYLSPFRKIAPWLLFINNLVFLFVGFGIEVLGFFIYNNAENFSTGEDIAYGLFGLGVSVIFFAISGIVVSFKYSSVVLYTHIVFIAVLFAGEVVFIVFAFLFNEYAGNFLSNIWYNDLSGNNKNMIQEEFDCVGFYSSSDSPGSFTDTKSANGGSSPSSGCFPTLSDLFNKYFTDLIICAFVVIGYQIYLISIIIFLIRMKRNMKKKETDIEFKSLRASSALGVTQPRVR